MENYFANFIKTGNPNGKGLPEWPANKGSITQHMNINHSDTSLNPEHDDRPRYLLP